MTNYWTVWLFEDCFRAAYSRYTVVANCHIIEQDDAAKTKAVETTIKTIAMAPKTTALSGRLFGTRQGCDV